MQVKPQILTLDKVNNMTFWHRERIEMYKKVLEDPDKENRLIAHECLICYYQDLRIGGQAFTDADCGNCHKVTTFADTDCNLLCEYCAKLLKLCIHCGADINYKKRRKL